MSLTITTNAKGRPNNAPPTKQSALQRDQEENHKLYVTITIPKEEEKVTTPWPMPCPPSAEPRQAPAAGLVAGGGAGAEGEGLALGHLGHLPLHLLARPLQLHHPALHPLQVQSQQLLLVVVAAAAAPSAAEIHATGGAAGDPPPRRLGLGAGRLVGSALLRRRRRRAGPGLADVELALLRRQRLHRHARRDPPVLGQVLARLQRQLLVVEAPAQRRALLQGQCRVRLHSFIQNGKVQSRSLQEFISFDSTTTLMHKLC